MKLRSLDVFANNLSGPGWPNELGSWIT